MKLPTFAECQHPLIQALHHASDLDLIRWFQQQPQQGQYFTAIFCRYSHLVYALGQNFAPTPIQTDYLFARTWRRIFQELPQVVVSSAGIGSQVPLSLQTWILNLTAVCMSQIQLPAIEMIHYSLADAPPPLWCYLEVALDRLPPAQRFMVVMAGTFHWGEARIAGYLQAEGEEISAAEVGQTLREGYQLLEAALPQDIQAIYLVQSGQLAAIAGVEASLGLANLLEPASAPADPRGNPAGVPAEQEEFYH